MGQFKANLGCIVSPSEKQNRAKGKREQRKKGDRKGDGKRKGKRGKGKR